MILPPTKSKALREYQRAERQREEQEDGNLVRRTGAVMS
jgi:hypothetical protein